jgi:hypothetical protein
MTVNQLGRIFYRIGKIISYRRLSFLTGQVYSTVYEISPDMLLSPLLLTAVTTR